MSTIATQSEPQLDRRTFDTAAEREPRWGCLLAAMLGGICLVCFGALDWWLDRPLFRRAIAARECLTIREYKLAQNESMLRMTFHYPPGIGLIEVSELKVQTPVEQWDFAWVEAPSLGLCCVYDRNDAGVLYLYHHREQMHWVPGRSRQHYVHDANGALVSDANYWQAQLDSLRALHPEIPYATLP